MYLQTCPLIEDTRVYRGNDVASHPLLLISNYVMLKRWKVIKL
jgi:hypothetical protein